MDQEEKRQRSDSSASTSEPDGVPDWARPLICDMAHIKNNTNATRNEMKELNHDIRGVKAEMVSLCERVKRMEVRQGVTDALIKDLTTQNKQISDENIELKEAARATDDRLDKLTDHTMRDTLTIHHLPLQPNIPRGKKETWEQTEVLLATFLSENTNQSPDEWLNKITRAHRGKPTSKSNVIHVCFRNWKHAQEVREMFRKAQGKIGNIFALDKFSNNTQERRNKCQTKRDAYRKDNPGVKLWIRYPATLMAKHDGEEKYKPIFTA